MRGRYQIQYGSTDIQLHAIEQLIDDSQTRFIAEILFYIERNSLLSKKAIQEILDDIEEKMEKEGLAFVSTHKGHPGELARPRRYEIAAALNRLRTLTCG